MKEPFTAGPASVAVNFAMSVAGPCLLCDSEHRLMYINVSLASLLRCSDDMLGKKLPEIFTRFFSLVEQKQEQDSEVFWHCLFSGKQTCDINMVNAQQQSIGRYSLGILPINCEGFSYTLISFNPVADLNTALSNSECSKNKYLHEKLAELSHRNEGLRQENVERRAVTRALLRAESRYRDIFDNAVEAIFQWTSDWILISANRSCAQMLGYSTVNEMLQNISCNGFCLCSDPKIAKRLLSELDSKGAVSNFEFELKRQDGSSLWVNLNARRVAGVLEQSSYYEGFMEDISERYDAQKRLEYQAFHDPLTGLANRALFTDHLQMALSRFMRNKAHPFAVMFLDLDHFKAVNDIHGHAVGDQVFHHVASLIHSCVREHDTVARFGGDEFGIILVDFEDADFVINAAERIREALVAPIGIGEHTVHLGVSIGIVMSSDKYKSIDQVLSDADAAMYKAKVEPAHYYQVFNMELEAESLTKMRLTKALRGADERMDFDIGFYPIVDINTKQFAGLEGILLWRQDQEQQKYRDIMQIAEGMSIGAKLNTLKLRKIFQEMSRWSARLGHPVHVHTRIGKRQVLQSDFCSKLQKMLEVAGVDPYYLHFEISDMELLTSNEHDRAKIVLENLRKLGVRLCLGNFGASVPAISLLHDLPVSSLKICKRIVENVPTDTRAFAVVKALTKLGKDVGVKVIVDGVNTQQHYDSIQNIKGCYCQGSLFSNVLSTHDVERYFMQYV